MARQAFKSLFCERFNCPLSEYEERAFREGLYFRAKVIAPVVLKLRPNFFAEDFKFIRYLGEAAGEREANTEVLTFHEANDAKPSLLRTGMKIRISGRKMSTLAHQLFSKARGTAGSHLL